jgi:histidinol-phosphatase (PHP family)
MLSNLHTHTTFCDGSATAEELVKEAIEKGFTSLGFSGHAYASYGLSYCLKNEDEYISEINRLKGKYSHDIEIYLGIEEDAFEPADRSKYEYIIGSMHYINVGGEYLPIDLGENCVKRCLGAFGGDVGKTSLAYYSAYYDYVTKRRPDVVGHFDLITKYDELGEPYFLGKSEHDEIAKRFIAKVAADGHLLEINTGAISRGLRKTPYPALDLLYEIKKAGGSVILNSDCHARGMLDCNFKEAKDMIKDVGFKEMVVLRKNKFTKVPIL